MVGSEATQVQVAYLTPAQARTLANVPDAPKVPDSGLTSDPVGNRYSSNATDPLSETLSLRDAAAEGVIPWTYEAAKMRLQRARRAGRPVPMMVGRRGRSDLYRRGDLIVWAESDRSPQPNG